MIGGTTKGTGNTMNRSPTLALARYAASTSLEALPREVRERTKQVIFDEMACAHFGRRSDAGALSAQYAVMFGGLPEARILGTEMRAPAPYAALANGTAGHGEEVDGTHVVGGHPGASTVHACVATAERQRASGAELINAVALAYDVGIRIVRACGEKFVVRDRFHVTSDLFYALGSTTAAGRILGLTPEQHCHALALASFQTNGLFALYAEKRHISKSFCNGQFAFAGISAALMASIGLEGNEDIFGAEHGVLEAWGVDGGREALTNGLGEDFEIMGANFKFLNAGFPIHTPVEAAMTLVRENGIAPDAIDTIHIGMPSNTMRVVDNRAMHNICVQDMLVASLVRGGLKLAELPFPAILDDPAFSRLRSRTKVAVDPDIEREAPNGRGARVTIATLDGRRHSLRVDLPRGHSRRGGVAWSDLAEKWRGTLTDCDVDRALDLARNLEELKDVNELTDIF